MKLRWHRDRDDYYAIGSVEASYTIERDDNGWRAYRNGRVIETHRLLSFCKRNAQFEEDHWNE